MARSMEVKEALAPRAASDKILDRLLARFSSSFERWTAAFNHKERKFESNVSKEKFFANVLKAKEYITGSFASFASFARSLDQPHRHQLRDAPHGK